MIRLMGASTIYQKSFMTMSTCHTILFGVDIQSTYNLLFKKIRQLIVAQTLNNAK